MKGYFFFNWKGSRTTGRGFFHAVHRIVGGRAGNFSGAGTQLYYQFDAAKYGALAGQPIPNNQIDPNFEDPIAKVFRRNCPPLPTTRK